MNYNEEIHDQILENFNLVCNVISQTKSSKKLKVDLSNVENIIFHKIPDTLKKNAPEDFYVLYTDFKAEYEKFRDFILYDKLIGKNIIALGGGFSSGKSSFLNTILGKNILPADIDPSTSVPTYIVNGDMHHVEGINVFDSKVSMKPRDIKKIAHGFGEIEDDDEKITSEITLGHILESIFFSTPFQPYKNIAFLDTPGYSKADSKEYSTKTDEQIARGQLNSSNYILWFVQADAGTITEEDIKFIKTIRADIPKLIIVNKADKKTVEDLKDIIDKIKSNLDIKGERYVGVYAFSSKLDYIDDKNLKEFIKNDIEQIKKQIMLWNQEIYESSFAWNFKKLFTQCKDYYEEEIDEESRKLTRLNTSITKLAVEDISNDILTPLQELIRDAQNHINELKEILKTLKILKEDFFTEIKHVSNIVGISMPEPSEIDLLEKKIKSPIDIINDYKKEKGIKTDQTIIELLHNTFSDIKPVLNKLPGGSEYHNELIDIIKNNCNVNSKDIHINDVLHKSKEYKQLLDDIRG